MQRTRKQVRNLNSWISTVKPTSTVPSTYSGLPADQDNWSCDDWIIYYKRMKAAMGKAKALEIVQIDAGNTGFFANIQFCKGDCDFINFFKSEGLPTGNFISDLYCGASSVVQSTTRAVTNVAASTSTAVSNVASSASEVVSNVAGTAGTLSRMLPIIVIGGVAVAGFIAYKRYGKVR